MKIKAETRPAATGVTWVCGRFVESQNDEKWSGVGQNIEIFANFLLLFKVFFDNLVGQEKGRKVTTAYAD